MFKKIAIVGAGLLGGSLLLALRKNVHDQKSVAEIIRIYTRNLSKQNPEWQKQFPKVLTDDLASATDKANLIILSMPVFAMPTAVTEIIKIKNYAESCILTDVGSTKAQIIKDLESITQNSKIDFIGSHPIAGSEKTGLGSAKAELFKGATCVVCPTENTNENAFSKIVKFWQMLEMNVKILSSKKHDKILANVSHLPHIVSSALILTALKQEENLAREISGTGLSDMTRLAAGEPKMWTGILQENRINAINAIKAIKSELSYLQNCLTKNKFNEVENFLAKAQKLRQKL